MECKGCGHKKEYRMVDVDGTNLEEMLVCVSGENLPDCETAEHLLEEN